MYQMVMPPPSQTASLSAVRVQASFRLPSDGMYLARRQFLASFMREVSTGTSFKRTDSNSLVRELTKRDWKVWSLGAASGSLIERFSHWNTDR